MNIYMVGFIGFITFGIITLYMAKTKKRNGKRAFLILTVVCWVVSLSGMIARAA